MQTLNAPWRKGVLSFALLVSVALAAACGGGGGGGGSGDDDGDPPPDAISQRLSVQDATFVEEAPPAPSADPEAPTLDTGEAPVQVVESDSQVDLEVTVDAVDGVSALLLRVEEANSYFIVEAPDTEDEDEGSSVLVPGAKAKLLFSATLSLLLPTDFNVSEFCVDVAAIDLSGRVSNYRRICFQLPEYDPEVTRKPVANAGGAQAAYSGDTVQLDGRDSAVPAGTPSYAWTQVSGPAVTILQASAPLAAFVAPAVSSGSAALVFQLQVSAGGQTSTSTTSVTVHPGAPAFAGDYHALLLESSMNGPGRDSGAFGRYAASVELTDASIAANTDAATGVAMVSLTFGPDYTYSFADQLKNGAGTYDITAVARESVSAGLETINGRVYGHVLSFESGLNEGIYVDDCSTCGGATELVRQLPSTMHLLPLSADLFATAYLYRDEAYVAVDSDGDTLEDAEDAQQHGRTSASAETILLGRKATDFTVAQLEGSYRVIGLALGMASNGERTSEVFLTRLNIQADGSVDLAELAYSETLRFGEPGAAVFVDEDEDPAESGAFQITAGADGALSVSEGGVLTAEGFATPDGSFFVLAFFDEDNGTAEGTAEVILATKGDGATAFSAGPGRVLGISNEYSGESGEDARHTAIKSLAAIPVQFTSATAFTVSPTEDVHYFATQRDGDDLPIVINGNAGEASTVSGAVDVVDFAGEDWFYIDLSEGDEGRMYGFIGVLSAPDGFGIFANRENAYTDASETVISDLRRGIGLIAPDNGELSILDNRPPAINVASMPAVPAGVVSLANGGAVTLTATVDDPDSGPAATTVSWRSRVGSFSAATGTTTTWTAPASGSGTVLLDAVVSDGDRSTLASVVVSYGP